jgi:hypothetical protein
MDDGLGLTYSAGVGASAGTKATLTTAARACIYSERSTQLLGLGIQDQAFSRYHRFLSMVGQIELDTFEVLSGFRASSKSFR